MPGVSFSGKDRDGPRYRLVGSDAPIEPGPSPGGVGPGFDAGLFEYPIHETTTPWCFVILISRPTQGRGFQVFYYPQIITSFRSPFDAQFLPGDSQPRGFETHPLRQKCFLVVDN